MYDLIVYIRGEVITSEVVCLCKNCPLSEKKYFAWNFGKWKALSRLLITKIGGVFCPATTSLHILKIEN